jgi:tetratricopeptide (TPR) repeat protein
VSLTPLEGFVLSRVDGQSSMSDVVALTPMPEEETLRCLYTLISGGFLEFGAKGRDLAPSTGSRQVYEIPILLGGSKERVERTPAKRGADSISSEDQSTRDEILAKHASLAGSTLYDCLGVRRNAKDTEIRSAYLALVRRYHPDRHRSPQLQDLQGALQEILARAAEAYEALYQPAARQRYDQCLRSEAPRGEVIASPIESPPPAPPTASQALAARYFREAKKFVANREYHEAVKLLEEVVELDATKSEYHRTLAQALENNPKWRKEAESHFRKAMKIDPFDMESIIGLAHLYWKAGMKQRARPLFAMALELDPDNRELSMILRQLER